MREKHRLPTATPGVRYALQPTVLGVALAIVLAPQLTRPALGADQTQTKAPSAALERSGAGNLMVAYQEALQAHFDSVLGADDAATAHLRAASAELALAQQAISVKPGAQSPKAGAQKSAPGAGAPGAAPGSAQPGAAPRSGPTSQAAPDSAAGGGGGPASQEAQNPIARTMISLQDLAQNTENDVNPRSTTRLVAAMTGVLQRLGRPGGGGGPGGQPLPQKMTAMDHVGEAYALVGQAQSELAMRNYPEAHDALGAAARQLDAASKAPGGKELAPDLSRMSAAVRDAEGPAAQKSPQAADATMRAVREITTSLTALTAEQSAPGSAP